MASHGLGRWGLVVVGHDINPFSWHYSRKIRAFTQHISLDINWAPTVCRAWLGTVRAGTMSGKSLATSKRQVRQEVSRRLRKQERQRALVKGHHCQGLQTRPWCCPVGFSAELDFLIQSGVDKVRQLRTWRRANLYFTQQLQELEQGLSSFRGLNSLRH